MDMYPGAWVVIGLASVGAVIWLAAIVVMARATRDIQARDQAAASRFDIEEPSAAGTLAGEAEVAGRPEDLSTRLAGLLARDGLPSSGPVKILSCDARELVFVSSGAAADSRYADTTVRRGRFRFTAVGSRTRIEYAIEIPSGRLMLGLGWLFVGLGLAALVAGCWLMFIFVVPNGNPTVRGQAFQMFQAIHFLWPPFLFASLARRPARMIEARVSALVHNLPYS
jgi:hypothetical protein